MGLGDSEADLLALWGMNVLGEKGLEQLWGKGSLHGVGVLQGHYQSLEGSIVAL